LQLDTGNVGAFDDFVDRVRQVLGDLGAERFDYLVTIPAYRTTTASRKPRKRSWTGG
jgi:hypothetical protein